MKEWFKKMTSRKWLMAVAGIVIVWVNPTIDAKHLMAMLGLPGLFIIMEGLKDFKNQIKG